MATPVYYTGDTWPPLSGTAVADLSTADSIRMIAKLNAGATVIAGTASFITDGSDGAWEYPWGASDLTVAGTYTPEIEVTWDALSSPPKIETFRDDAVTFLVKADND